MTLTKIEFDVLSAVARRCGSLEQAAEKSGHSLDVVKSVLASDKGKACATDTPRIDEYGLGSVEALLGPNAIIMAAGLSSRFAPLQFEVSRR